MARWRKFGKPAYSAFWSPDFAFKHVGVGPPGGRVITVGRHAAGMKNHPTPWEHTKSPKSSFAGPNQRRVKQQLGGDKNELGGVKNELGGGGQEKA